MGESLEGFTFDLNDFRRQLGRIRRLGSLRDITKALPNLDGVVDDLEPLDLDAEIRRMEGIIDGMTPAERSNPRSIDAPRRRRIAAGAGVLPAEVASLVDQYTAMAAVVRQMASLNLLDKIRALTGKGPTPRPGRLPARLEPDSGIAKAPEPLPRAIRKRVQPQVPIDVRPLRADQPLPALERRTLRRLWEILAHHGRASVGQEPWFSNWNRNLRLWDFHCD